MISDKALVDAREFLNYDPKEGHFYWKSDGASPEWRDKKGYLIILGLGSGNSIRAHRLAWYFVYGALPDKDLDHINGNKSDNRIANLRLASRSQNMQNQRKPKATAPTKYLGVGRARDGRFRAQITVGKKQTFLGHFDTPHEAHAAYLKAKAELHPFATVTP